MTTSSDIHRRRRKAAQLLEQHRLKEALHLYEAICADAADDTDAWLDLGIINGRLGHMAAAADCFRHVIARRPDLPEAHFNLGNALKASGDLEEAALEFQQALALRPDWPQALNNLGNTLRELGRHDQALACYDRALTLQPAYPQAQLNRALALQVAGRMREAVASLEGLLTQQPHLHMARRQLINALISLGDLDPAKQHAALLAASHPGDPDIATTEAMLAQMEGDWQRAWTLLQPLLDSPYGHHPRVLTLYARLCPRVDSCADASTRIERALALPNTALAKTDRIHLHFALGNVYDRLGDYGRAFDNFHAANALRAQRFDNDRYTAEVDATIALFTPAFMRDAPRSGVTSDRPVFVVGMPRSGTTLVEQILASHGEIAGAGELTDMADIVQSLAQVSGDARGYPQAVAGLSASMLTGLAQRYLARLDGLASGRRHVVDKMPQNFNYLGLIALLFPRARIIHCVRDARDTCLSCYFQNFSSGQWYSGDLESLGRYYRDYRRLMAHWRQVLPIPMLEVCYEALVRDTEGGVRRMLDFLALSWDERCLHHYEHVGQVRTASHDQVRQPIYTASIGRWRHYASQLKPLLDILDG